MSQEQDIWDEIERDMKTAVPDSALNDNNRVLKSRKQQRPADSDVILFDKLNALRLDPTDEFEEDPAVLSAIIDNKTYKLFSAGNISVISGAAKSRKTFLCSAVAAAAVANDPDKIALNMFASLPPEQNKVLYFDTEQSAYHAQKVNKRICYMAGNPKPDNFFYYKLRGIDATECLDLIKAAVSYFKGQIGMIFIDGIADLLSTGINDEQAANKVIFDFMKISEEMNVHICTILHTNKGNAGTLTGWIGTQILKKAETVLLVEKDKERENVSHVKGTETRDIGFKSFAFEIDNNGIPQPTSGGLNILPNIKDIISNEQITSLARRLGTKGKMNKSDYQNMLQLEIKRIEEHENIKIDASRRRLNKFYDFMLLDGIILEVQKGRSKTIELNRLHPLIATTEQTKIEDYE